MENSIDMTQNIISLANKDCPVCGNDGCFLCKDDLSPLLKLYCPECQKYFWQEKIFIPEKN